MKNLIYISILSLFFAGCQGEDPSEISDNELQNANLSSHLVDICHYDSDNDEYFVIAVNENALLGHMDHGDVYDMDGDGYYPENPCGLDGGLGEYDCDDSDPTINPGEGNCGCSNCPNADLSLYGPYTQRITGEINGKPFVGLDGDGDGSIPESIQMVIIIYGLNFENQWEFWAAEDWFENGQCETLGVSCDDPNGCEFLFPISEEEALCLIEEALELDIPEFVDPNYGTKINL